MTAPVSLAEQIAAVERAQIRVAAAIDMIGQFAPDQSYVDHCMSSAAALRAAAETLKRMQEVTDAQVDTAVQVCLTSSDAPYVTPYQMQKALQIFLATIVTPDPTP